MSSILILLCIPVAVSQLCKNGLPVSESTGILAVHNDLRDAISNGTYTAKGVVMPAAHDPLPDLVWNCALEQSAQTVANTCEFKHSGLHGVGENLYNAWSTKTLSTTGQGILAAKAWENEFQKYGWSTVQFTMQLMNTGHATQMAWSRTTDIGCGIASCSGGQGVMVVCHYKQQGNVIGMNIYEPK